MLRLPDTGENTSYTNTPGEDADYTINPPFFTVNGNGTATDTVTGLMWQQTDGGEMTIERAITYCDTLTLGGFTDWRLPNPHEAFSILNHQNANPAINTSVFPNTGAEYWWSSLRQANDNNKVWCTNAGGGIGNHPKTETISAGGTKKFHVRALRDVTSPTTIPNHFTDNGDGTITDHLTNLVWQKLAYTDSITWEQALTYADSLTLSGFTDWRLPNIKELQSLNDETRINPSVNNTFFTNIATNKYWSSTTLPNQTAKAWYLNSQFGITTYDVKTVRHYLLCVRGNQTALPLTLLSFTAKLQEKRVVLNWKTTHQINTQRCMVERSQNGAEWSVIGSLKATNTNAESNYSFTDERAISGSNYYRIKFVDNDGKSSYSNILMVDLQKTDVSINVFPNPTAGLITLQISNTLKKDLHVTLADLSGKVVLKKDFYKGSTICILETTTVYGGTYILTVIGDGLRNSFKVEIRK